MTRFEQHKAANQGRKAGIGLHLTSLAGKYGIGDIAYSSQKFIDSLVAMDISVWQFLPTGPTAYGDSPYQPLSAFANNEMLIGLEPLIEAGFLRLDEVVALTQLPHEYVDYGRLIPKKKALIELAARRFQQQASSAERAAYADFLQQHDAHWLHEYAVFRVIKAHHQERSWLQWESTLAKREQSPLARFVNQHRHEIEAIKVAQFLFWEQWQTLHAYARQNGITLFGDMPIYVSLDSADAWANPEMLRFAETGVPSFVAGVPPDYFSADGQLWGNPLYDWDYHAQTGYRWWLRRIEHSMAMMDTIKIDHFRGFESYWAVPYGAEHARDGSWDQGPSDGLFDAIRKNVAGADIVAENLGLITDEVEALRHRHAIPGMNVLQFDICHDDFSLDSIAADTVCYTGTHDNDTTVGWFFGQGSDTRSPEEIQHTQHRALDVTSGRPDTIHLDLTRFAMSTKADLAIAPMQDFLGLGSDTRINTPGTTANNWRWRVTETQLNDELCDLVGQMVSDADRQQPARVSSE